jgi:cell division protein FtsL
MAISHCGIAGYNWLMLPDTEGLKALLLLEREVQRLEEVTLRLVTAVSLVLSGIMIFLTTIILKQRDELKKLRCEE